MMRPPDSLAALRVALFGGPVVRRDAHTIPLSPQQGAAVALVYGHGGSGVARDRLIWMLWETDDGAASRHRLSQLFYGLGKRKGLDGLFVLHGEQILPNVPAVTSDLQVLEDLVRDQRFADAAGMLGQGFLGTLHKSPSREFDDWRDARSLVLRSRVRDAAAKAWSDAEATADWGRARVAAEALLLMDPESESYLRCVMKARALTGAAEEAEAAFRGWAEAVGVSNGRRGSPSTNELLARIRSVAQRGRAVKRDRQPLLDPAFVGRSTELQSVRDLLGRSLTLGPIALLITGEPGIGKTRLMEEVCNLADIDGVSVLRTRCSLLEQQIPLNPLIDILSAPSVRGAVDAIGEPWRSVLHAVLRPIDGTSELAPTADPGILQRRLFEAIHHAFIGLVQTKTVLVWIDDAQWADETSMAACEFMLRRWNSGPLVVCLTVRDEPGRSLTSRLLEKTPERQVVIRLADLREAAARSLVESVTGPDGPTDVITQIVALAAGNPLYLIELALDFLQGRSNYRDEGVQAPPVSIQKILGDRVACLSTGQRSILEVLSVGTLTFSQLRTFTHLNGSDLSHELTALGELRLVRLDGQRASFGHELLRQALYSSLPVPYAAFLHGRIAEVIERDDGDIRVGELAVHYDRAGDSRKALQFASAAAAESQRDGAFPEAVRFLRVARRHTGDESRVALLLLREGELLVQMGDLGAAVGILSLAEDGLRRGGLAGDAIACATGRLNALSELGAVESSACTRQMDRLVAEAETLGRWDLFLKATETKMRMLERAGDIPELRRTAQAIDRVPADCGAEVRCMAYSLKALDVLFGGGTGWDAAVQAVKIARQAGLSHLLERAENRLFVTLVLAGRLESPGSPYSIEEYLGMGRRTGDFWLRVNCFNSVAAWMVDVGDLPQARRFVEEAIKVLGPHEESELLARVLINRGEVELYEGQFSEGLRSHGRALEMTTTSGMLRLMAQAGAGLCALKSGDLQAYRRLSAGFHWDGDGYFECTLPTWFELEIARAQGNLTRGVEFLREVSNSIEGRLHLTWLKLALLEIEYTYRSEPRRAIEKARAGRELCGVLSLSIRAQQFDSWISRLGETPPRIEQAVAG